MNVKQLFVCLATYITLHSAVDIPRSDWIKKRHYSLLHLMCLADPPAQTDLRPLVDQSGTMVHTARDDT